MATSEYKDFIDAMPEEWQHDEDDEEQVKVDIADLTTINTLLKDKLNAIEEDIITTKE